MLIRLNAYIIKIWRAVIVYLACSLLSSAALFPQAVNTELDHPVYEFLEHMSLKGVIQFHDEARPLSRQNVTDLLFHIQKNANILNEIELEKLNWFTDEFTDKESAMRLLLSHKDSLVSLQAEPAAGGGVSIIGKTSSYNRWWGGNVNIRISDWFSGWLEFRDFGEFGRYIDKEKTFTPERGYFINAWPADGIEFNDVRGGVSVNWKWGAFSFEKSYQRWGHGKYGQLILSDKAAAFPFVRLELRPAEWLSFFYIHGWLTSNVDDSLYFYPIGTTKTNVPVYRGKYLEKYIAANILRLTPVRFLDITFGNSVIYSNPSPMPEYLIPFMIFKFLDHNAGRNNHYGNNGQLFADFKLNYPNLYSFYGTLFLDMASIREIGTGDTKNLWYGFTVGVKRINIGYDNLDINLEYTKITPRVYEHNIKALTYKHLDYELGHWMGQNADQFHIQLDYAPLKNLKISLYAERVRKGSLWDSELFYFDEVNQPFLSSPVRKDYNTGIIARFHASHRLSADLHYRYSEKNESAVWHIPEPVSGSRHSIIAQFSYGYR